MPGPEIVADAVERALRRPRRRIIVPRKYRLAVFLTTAFPGVTDRRFAGKPGDKLRQDERFAVATPPVAST
jgi:hypothetical protein